MCDTALGYTSMMKKRFIVQRVLRRYALSLSALLVALLIAAGLLLWHALTVGNEVGVNQTKVQDMNNQLDTKLAEIKARKAAEATEAKQAAAKAAEQAKQAEQEAEAQKVAAQSIAPATDITQLDSTQCNREARYRDPASVDVIVNKKHCLQPLTYTPADLVTSNGATLSTHAIDAYNQLFAAAAAAGQPFYTTSSYRSYQTQISTYNYWVAISGAAAADTYSARPGYSEHQTGLAFDVAANGCVLDCFGSTTQYQWFQHNAARFGFIQRYYAGKEAITGYKAEEWHYRYVGVQVAQDMQAKGIKTLEEYRGVSGGDY